MVLVEGQSILDYMIQEVIYYYRDFVLCLLKTYNYYIYSGEITISSIYMSTRSRLTCISTGGPATTVTWTRGSDEDSLMPVSDSTHVSVLVNATTAQYMHIIMAEIELLTVYGCSVSNNKPSSAKVIATIKTNGITLHVFEVCLYYPYCSSSFCILLQVN